MSKAEMFEALHPDPEKQGTSVTKATYEAYKKALLKVIPASEEGMEFGALAQGRCASLKCRIVGEYITGMVVHNRQAGS